MCHLKLHLYHGPHLIKAKNVAESIAFGGIPKLLHKIIQHIWIGL